MVEVAQHIGDDVVRCVAMGPTDGVKRGMDPNNPILPPLINGQIKSTTLIPVSRISVSVLCSAYVYQFLQELVNVAVKEMIYIMK